MLTEVEQAGAAGIRNIQWDAVELPSQFMENFCCDKHTMYVCVFYFLCCPSRVLLYEALFCQQIHLLTNLGWIAVLLSTTKRRNHFRRNGLLNLGSDGIIWYSPIVCLTDTLFMRVTKYNEL